MLVVTAAEEEEESGAVVLAVVVVVMVVRACWCARRTALVALLGTAEVILPCPAMATTVGQ